MVHSRLTPLYQKQNASSAFKPESLLPGNGHWHCGIKRLFHMQVPQEDPSSDRGTAVFVSFTRAFPPFPALSRPLWAASALFSALVPHLCRTCAALVPHLCRTCAALVPHLCRNMGGSAPRRPLYLVSRPDVHKDKEPKTNHPDYTKHASTKHDEGRTKLLQGAQRASRASPSAC